MAVESAADRAAMLDPDEFGVTMQWSPASHWEPSDLAGIFDREFEAVLEDEPEAGIGSFAPRFQFASADAPPIAEGDWLVHPDGTRYRVAGPPEPDGTGFTIARLHRE